MTNPVLAVVGSPIAHSRSPQVIQKMMKGTKVLRINPTGDDPMKLARALDASAVFVTAPYKKTVKADMTLFGQDESMGLNLVVPSSTGLTYGYNTDPAVFDKVWEQLPDKTRTFAIIGAGAAASTIYDGLIRHGVNRHQIFNVVAGDNRLPQAFQWYSLRKLTDILTWERTVVFDALSVPLIWWDRLDTRKAFVVSLRYTDDSPAINIDGMTWLEGQAERGVTIIQYHLHDMESESFQYPLPSGTLNPDKVLLSGFSYSGKTTVGARLAAALGRQFIDLDTMISSSLNLPSAGEAIRKVGLNDFRKMEAEALYSIAGTSDKVVVAAGGGVLGTESGWGCTDSFLRVWLYSDLDTMDWRRSHDPGDRPLLDGIDQTTLVDMLERRNKGYLLHSDLVVDGRRPIGDVVDTLRDEVGALHGSMVR